MGRGRKPIVVDKNVFQNLVSDLEQRFGFLNRSALWQAVSDTGWAKSIRLSPQVAMLKAKALAIEVKTPLGQRGRAKGSGAVPNAGKRKHKQRMSLEVVSELKTIYQESLHKSVDRAAAGSMKAAIKLKCVDCCGGSKKEVALCEIRNCPLWGFRPYQGKYTEASADA